MIKKLFSLFSILLTSSVWASAQVPAVVATADDNIAAANSAPLLSTANITQFTTKQIANTGATWLDQVLENAPGLQIQDLYGDGSNVAVGLRGFGDNAAGNSLILMDGEPLTNPTLAVPDLNFFDIDDIAFIEVLPGSAGVLYGDQAVGGVVNITSKAPAPKQHSAVVRFGSYATQQYHAAISDILRNGIGYRLSLNYYDSDNYRVHNSRNQAALHGILNYQHDNQLLFAEYDLKQQKTLFAGALSGAQVQQNPRQASNFTDFGKETVNHLRAGYTLQLSDQWQWHVLSMWRMLHGNGILFSPFSEAGNQILLQNNVNGIVDIFKHSVNVLTGVELQQGDYVFNSPSYFSKAMQSQASIYQQFTVPLYQSIELIIGGRVAGADNQLNALFSNFDTTNSAAISNVELAWQAQSNLRFFLRRAGSYRFPKTDENALTLNGLPLATQTGISYETGVKWDYQKLATAFTLYQLNLRNEILFVPVVNGFVTGFNQNLSPTQRFGAMLSLNYPLLAKWRVGGDYSWVNARFSSGLFSGKQLPFVANNTWDLHTDWRPADHWLIYGEANFVGSRYPGADIANLAAKLPSSMIFNANVSYAWKIFNLGLRLNNITDQRYYAYAVFANNVANQAMTYYYPAPGRNVMLTLSANI